MVKVLKYCKKQHNPKITPSRCKAVLFFAFASKKNKKKKHKNKTNIHKTHTTKRKPTNQQKNLYPLLLSIFTVDQLFSEGKKKKEKRPMFQGK